MHNYKKMISLIENMCVSPRFPGSDGSLHARNIIISHLQEMNIKYNLFFSTIPKWIVDGTPSIEFLVPEKLRVEAIPAVFSPPTPIEGIEGKVLNAGQLKMLDSFDWERYSIVGADRNILAYLISTDYGAQIQPLPEDSWTIPHVILDSSTLQKLQSWFQSGLEVYVKVYNPTKISGNVDIISIVSEEPSLKPYPLICAHYDTIFNSLGAHDNGSGIAVTLQLANELILSGIPCCVAFFDGEEANKAGSRAFVKEAKKSGILSNISFVLEIDSVGIGEEISLLCSKKLYKKLRNLIEQYTLQSPTHYKISINAQSKIAFCDVWPFMVEGIPAIRMLSRGGIGHNIMHTCNDTPVNIETETLSVGLEIAYITATQLKIS